MDLDYQVFGTISRVSLEYFTHKMLPPLPGELNIDELMKTLKRLGITNKSRRPFAKNGHWSGFAAQTPLCGKRTKTQAFRSFPHIIDSIHKAVSLKTKGIVPPHKFVQKVNEEPDDVEQPFPADTLPDAYIVPYDHDAQEPVTWNTVSAVGWYKRDYKRDKVSGKLSPIQIRGER